jgi:hypothetical protein
MSKKEVKTTLNDAEEQQSKSIELVKKKIRSFDEISSVCK